MMILITPYTYNGPLKVPPGKQHGVVALKMGNILLARKQRRFFHLRPQLYIESLRFIESKYMDSQV